MPLSPSGPTYSWLLAPLPAVYHLLEGSTEGESAMATACTMQILVFLPREKGPAFQSKMKIPPSFVCSQCFLLNRALNDS